MRFASPSGRIDGFDRVLVLHFVELNRAIAVASYEGPDARFTLPNALNHDAHL